MKKQQGQQKKVRNTPITEQQILEAHHKFLRSSSQSSSSESESRSREKKKPNKKEFYEQYGQQQAKKYYDKLIKDYALVDLSRYQQGKIGCRWRTRNQVIEGKGQSICGSLACSAPSTQTFETPFTYVEQGEKKCALVKVGLCGGCGEKLLQGGKGKRVAAQERKEK